MILSIPITLIPRNIGAAILVIIGAILVSKTQKYSTAGGLEYERRMRLKFAGAITIVFAMICLGVKFYSDNVLSYSIDVDSLPVSSTIHTEESAAPEISATQPVDSFSSKAREPEFHSATTDVVPSGIAAPIPHTNVIPTASEASTAPAVQAGSQSTEASAESVAQLIREATQLVQQKKFDAALEKVNAVVQLEPQSEAAYLLRGSIYGQKKLWDQAELDYRKVLEWDNKNVAAQFNLAEVAFQQKKYDDARAAFVTLEADAKFGDLATYKTYLCDLFGDHEAAAAQELDSFNQVGSNASYYFANAAWLLYHQKTEDSRSWLMSAANIYSPDKFRLYAASLIDLGYLPLPSNPKSRLTQNG